MTEIFNVIKKTLSQSTMRDFSNFVKRFPPEASWYILSDYCLDDKNRVYDTWTFSVLLNHDNATNIKSYIQQHAPKDLKNARNISGDFLAYLNSPVIFHFSFLLSKSEKFLAKAFSTQKIQDLLQELGELTIQMGENVPETARYWQSVRSRIELFRQDSFRRGFNQKLGRQLLLTSLFESIISFQLWLFNAEPHIAWVSDRDAIIDRYGGVVYDLAFIYILLQQSEVLVKPSNESYKLVDGSKFHYVTPEKAGAVFFDELIRIPDYIAGTLATQPFKSQQSKEKHKDIVLNSIANSSHHAVIELLANKEMVTARRLKYVF